MWATLAGREDGIVDALLEVGLLILAEEDHTGTRTTEGLVAAKEDDCQFRYWLMNIAGRSLRGGADNVAMLEWVVLDLGSDKT